MLAHWESGEVLSYRCEHYVTADQNPEASSR